MEIVRKINDELAIASPLTFHQFQQLAEAGFQSILNLRLLDQPDLRNEQDFVVGLGLRYANLAIDSEQMTPEIAIQALCQMDGLPKPLLVYCNNSKLSAAMVLMYIAIHQGETISQAIRRAERLKLFRVNPSSMI